MDHHNSEHSTQKQQFRIADIVWSKIVGYPWWPATIVQLPSSQSLQYKVQFLADKTYSHLPANKLIHYDEGKAKYQDRSKSYKGLERAIGCAERVRGRSLRTLGGSGLFRKQNSMSYRQVQLNEGMDNFRQAGSEINIKQLTSYVEYRQKRFRTWNSKPNQEIVRVNQPIAKPKKQRKLNLAYSLLARYKLFDIPPVQERQCYQPSSTHKSSHIHHQSTPISEDAMRIKFIRKINEILRKKELSNASVTQKISVYLADSIINKKKQGNKGAHGALFQWINCSDGAVIEDSYKNWAELQEKHNTSFTQNAQMAFRKRLEEIK